VDSGVREFNWDGNLTPAIEPRDYRRPEKVLGFNRDAAGASRVERLVAHNQNAALRGDLSAAFSV
jgi:hypothetical protein